LAKTEVRMAIDPFKVVAQALNKVKKKPSTARIIAIDYDETADVLYIKFKHSKTVDNEALDEDGLILASLNQQNEIVGLTIMEASTFTE